MVSLKSKQAGGNLSKTWLCHTGRTIWNSDTWRSSRCSAPPATGPSLGAALLIRAVETGHPWGGSSKWLLNAPVSHPSLRGVVLSKSPQAHRPAGCPKRASELSLPVLRPQENRFAWGGDGMAEVAVKSCAYLALQATPRSQGRRGPCGMTGGRPYTPTGLGNPAGQLAQSLIGVEQQERRITDLLVTISLRLYSDLSDLVIVNCSPSKFCFEGFFFLF